MPWMRSYFSTSDITPFIGSFLRSRSCLVIPLSGGRRSSVISATRTRCAGSGGMSPFQDPSLFFSATLVLITKTTAVNSGMDSFTKPSPRTQPSSAAKCFASLNARSSIVWQSPSSHSVSLRSCTSLETGSRALHAVLPPYAYSTYALGWLSYLKMWFRRFTLVTSPSLMAKPRGIRGGKLSGTFGLWRFSAGRSRICSLRMRTVIAKTVKGKSWMGICHHQSQQTKAYNGGVRESC